MRRLRAAAVVPAASLTAAAPAAGQEPPPRLAAPADCATNPHCAPGLATVYGLDVRSVLVPLAVADAGISALDDGTAEIAVVARLGPRPLALARGENRNLFVTKSATAQGLGIVRISDLARYWPQTAKELQWQTTA